MAFDFPSSPITGQSYTAGGITYVWNGYAWTGGPVADLGQYVKKAGDVMTGGLTIQPVAASANLILDHVAGQTSILQGQRGSSMRWSVALGGPEAESGGNVGSNFGISRYSDAGALIDNPVVIDRATGQVTGNLAQPSALCHRAGAGNTALGTGVWTKVNIGSLGFSVGGNFTIAGANLNIPKKGIYLVGASLDFQFPTATGSSLVGVCLNSLVPFMQSRTTNSSANNYRYVLNAQRLVQLDVGDALTLAGFSSIAGVTCGDGNDVTYLWATMVAAQ